MTAAQTPATDQEKLVGPVVRGFDPSIVDAVIEAAYADNPDADIVIDDHAGYVRIHAPRFLRITRASLETAAGQEFPLHSLEPALVGFAGRIRYLGDDELHFYLDREE
ncbi:toluene-4-monooxygenase system protein D [Mycolicibacterium hassiacum DSM 44199]|jgi:toluene monooxygenase system protein D|uniref:Toluene-4-monooxygenase system protein D n=1 Tax=Mycolicibacterium hassiacum (strain DSM 44199 / CIP 105218 / JCM 12690 / 3849) TaxID=1122247 RepID=K5B9D8_MYCHD|nr:MmoB/DmpM family protein [Mycolicibacterium hassiacum]EKF25273.1 toluene-4-monooxygenase system protein D [Mycolicibacterium hassiacum DSM 44199]MBX5488453.1 MmoB/DmpM family protein [Mycolicibacterium hassiacum]MDA4087806.1 monooxygenase [Mycolicibacterium hassiacum DSM 44199]PZN25299.1 MAG: monooxygenase [Mycolicibacterium hassiacum]VCT93098.1 Toluene-4-monooxygenase system protein D [Mycolicibacterium hassiacum DSM 44199]